jgi:hypothetical protein
MVVPLSPHVLKADVIIGRPAYIFVVLHGTGFVIDPKIYFGLILGLTIQEKMVAA